MRLHKFFPFCLALLSLGCLLGCGGGSENSQTQHIYGYADFNVTWPTRQRVVPNGAQSMLITVTGKSITPKNLSIKYPDTTGTVPVLPFGTFTYTVLASPNTDGTGTPVGQASGSFTLSEQNYHATIPLNLDMTSDIVSLTITPRLTTLQQGETEQLQLTPKDAGGNVLMTNNSMSLSSSNPAVVSVTSDFQVTGVAAGTATITATESDSGKTASLSITVPEVTISITPPTISTFVGNSVDLTATVTGATDTRISWSIQEGTAGGIISSTGHYTAPTTPGTYHVVATSVSRPAISTTVPVTVSPVTVSISPASVTISTNTTQQFSATVGGTTNTGVLWSVKESGGGTITGAGLYTAPATPGTYHILAMSIVNPAVTATATITVNRAVKIYIADSSNNRIVQMNDMTGAGWTTCQGFNYPWDVSIGPDGKIYVADNENNRIVRMDDMTGAYRKTLQSSSSDPKPLNGPQSIAFGPDGKIYVADTFNSRIVRMNDMTGAGWTTFGTWGSGTGQFESPEAVAVGADGKIYVADDDNSRIVCMNDMTGSGWTTLGTEGGGVDQFLGLEGIAIGPDGKIYTADWGNRRIERMDDMSGTGWTTFGSDGSGPNQFARPMGIALDQDGKIYVVDLNNCRIVRMDDMTGAGWTTLGGSQGSGVGQFLNPSGIAVSSQ